MIPNGIDVKKYHFAFGVDANFVKYAGIVMTSIVLNNLGKSFCFHIIFLIIRDDADDIGFGINDTAQGAVILPHSQD